MSNGEVIAELGRRGDIKENTHGYEEGGSTRASYSMLC